MRNFIFFCALLAAFYGRAENPCKKDIETLCKGIEPGGGAIIKCLKENDSKISNECKAHQQQMKGALKEVQQACHDDIEKFCKGIEPGKGRVRKCMRDHKEELSQKCKEEMKDLREKAKSK
jgi:Cysteine rich repeat